MIIRSISLIDANPWINTIELEQTFVPVQNYCFVFFLLYVNVIINADASMFRSFGFIKLDLKCPHLNRLNNFVKTKGNRKI